VSHSGKLNDPDLRDRLYELLEHDHLPHSVGSRFVRLIVLVIALDVSAVVLDSVPDYAARLGWLFTAVKIGALIAFALEYVARLWSVAGHSPRRVSPLQDRIEYAVSSLGIIDLLAFLPASLALVADDRKSMAVLGVLPFFKLVRYSPAMRSLLSAVHSERRTLVGCLVILTGAVLLFASLLYAIEHDAQPDKFGTIPQAMWWARDARHRRLWRRRAGHAARQIRVGLRHRLGLRNDRAAGRNHLDGIRR
jgi:voltage-gated potassium channel